MTHRPTLSLTLGTLVLALALAGCGQKADQSATGTTSDSLLASSPIEQPQGQLPAQTDVQQPTPTPSPEPATSKPATSKPKPSTPKPAAPAPGVSVPAGTGIKVTMNTALTSETAHAGDSWSGTVKEAVVVGSSAPFAAGSTVHGIVVGAMPAEKGGRAFLVLRVTSIESNGMTHSIDATADSLIAGSTRKRNIGAIAGGAAAGALIGKAVGGSGKGAVIGGILGGAAATGAVAASKGFQQLVAEGAELVFHVDRTTEVRL